MSATISIVIPTRGIRPALLARAINSSEASRYEIEIIVVVNGPEAENFQLPNHQFSGTIIVKRTPVCGVSNARNIGLDAATGVLTRFLDDDDYLVPEVAWHQYEYALASDADVVSSRMRAEDGNGNSYGESAPLNKNDPYCDLLSVHLHGYPIPHVYKTSAIKALRWNTSVSFCEDYDWLHRVARAKEQKWLVYDEVVAVWYHHRNDDRLTFTSSSNQGAVTCVEAIISTYHRLKAEGRLTRERELATARGLWHCAHWAFYWAPCYWSKIVKLSISLDKNVMMTSKIKIYRWAAAMHIPVLLIEWAMIPKRHLNNLVRKVRGFFSKYTYIKLESQND
jgi:glycosyltransferase involved in cell wall biosynthesis